MKDRDQQVLAPAEGSGTVYMASPLEGTMILG